MEIQRKKKWYNGNQIKCKNRKRQKENQKENNQKAKGKTNKCVTF